MNILFYIAFAFVTLYSFCAIFYDLSIAHPIIKIFVGIAAILAVVVLIKYKIVEKQQEHYRDYIASVERQELNRKIDELKDKERKGLLSDADYSRYIAYQLEQLNLNIIRQSGKYRKDFIVNYFSQVEKIPSIFNFEEWKETEKTIYESTIDEINSIFNIHGMFSSSGRTELIDLLKTEREKLLKAKEREFKK